ncbi:hypothetical protein C8R47DRAFT_1165406 [Mycena vitilis]|nr:hypothetical protein C8R47DRAFT_1165406 [Mycena vitilis]
MDDLHTGYNTSTPWTCGTQAFVVENAPISDSEDGSPSVTACAMLLDATVLPLLSREFSAPPPNPDPLAFYVADAGIKGAGMFAARDIPAGSMILVDRPIAVVPSNVNAPWKRVAFDALLPRISQISRERLSCGLNTAVKWDPASFSVCMFTLRPIRAGEEIHNQYIDVLAPRAEGRAELARYGFECMCVHCDLPDDAAVARSDAARTELRNWRHLHPRFLPWSTDMCRADDAIIVSNTRALALIEQEGLWGLQIPFIEEIALSYAILGDEQQFRHWAQQVVDLCEGQDPERLAKFAGWIADPKTYKRWGWRGKQRMILDREKPPVEIDISIPW